MTPPAPAPTASSPSLTPLSNRETRELKARAQRLNAVTKLGKGGISPEFITGVNRELTHHELIKVKLTEFKDQRFELAEQIAARTASHLVSVIGHVLVLYRPKPQPETATPSAAPATPPARAASRKS